MIAIKLSDFDELTEISTQLCIITYLQSLVQYGVHNNIISGFCYKFTREDALRFLLDCQENTVADLRHILTCNKHILHI